MRELRQESVAKKGFVEADARRQFAAEDCRELAGHALAFAGLSAPDSTQDDRPPAERSAGIPFSESKAGAGASVTSRST